MVLDLKIGSPWIGCDWTDCGNNCTYWVHACCTKQHSSAMISTESPSVYVLDDDPLHHVFENMQFINGDPPTYSTP